MFSLDDQLHDQGLIVRGLGPDIGRWIKDSGRDAAQRVKTSPDSAICRFASLTRTARCALERSGAPLSITLLGLNSSSSGTAPPMCKESP